MSSNLRLSQEQIQILKLQGADFKKWIETDKGKRDIEGHREHEHYFKEKLSPENLDKITDNEFAEVWKESWTSKFWGNKDWYVKNRLINPNGIEKLREGFKLLLYGSEDFVKRYDNFRQNVSGFGVALLSEFLNMVFPDKFCLWNDKPKTVLPFLRVNGLPENLFKYNTATGEQYQQCINYLTLIKNELSEFGISDFIDLDIFFWHIFEDVMSAKDKKVIQSTEITDTHSITNLEDLILSFDKDRNFLGIHISEEDAMKLREQFISNFPPDEISEIKIDNYVQGKRIQDTNERNRNTFCYHLEFGLDGLGALGGGTAEKFGIYYDSKNKKYVYNENKFHSPEEAFKEILSQINTLIESGKRFANDKNWQQLSDAFEEIDELTRPVKSKILSVYFPDSFPLINSHNGIIEILQSLFGLPRDKIKDEFILNKEILWELKENHPIMKNWSNFDYSYFVWYAWKNNANNTKLLSVKEELSDINQSKINFWVVRAGGKGEEEKIALDNNVITIAWNELPDLSSLKNKNELKEQYEKILQENDNTIAQNVGQIWSFMREIRVGDLVFLPLLSTKTKNIAICKIVGDYEYKEITKDVKHIRRVEWLNKGIPNNEFDDNARKSFGSGRTVYSISRKDVIKSIVNTLEKNGISLPDIGLGIYKDIISNGFQEKIKPILTVLDVANQTYFPVNMIKEIEELLVDKKQIIFYGPPGTSKTYVARKFAEYFAQGIENVEIVQFHQSYAYEDFIEGIRPKITPNGDATGFSKQQGLFKKLAEECSKHPEKRYVLIIDEINRGNISKIFGELIYLLEYRDEAISLTYSPDEKFSIPSNLYIIGTMNSADRSIAFVDYALRRRFYFIDFYSTSNNILENWFKANNVEEEIESNILNMLGQINEQITQHLGKEYQIGYSFFMLKKLDREKVNQIISYAVIPMLEQYFFGRGEKLDELKHLCSSFFLSPSGGVIPPNPENH